MLNLNFQKSSGQLEKTSNIKETNGNNIAGTYNNAPASPSLTVTANGAPTFDGVTLQLNDRFLIKDQTNKIQNGIYTCTTVGDVNTQTVFTRSSDLNKAAKKLEKAIEQLNREARNRIISTFCLSN